MATHPAKPTRGRLAGLGGLALTDPARGAAGAAWRAVARVREQDSGVGQGRAGSRSVDEAIIQIMEHHGVPGAALTITRNGKLVLAKGYGWQREHRVPVKPDTLFGLASRRRRSRPSRS